MYCHNMERQQTVMFGIKPVNSVFFVLRKEVFKLPEFLKRNSINFYEQTLAIC